MAFPKDMLSSIDQPSTLLRLTAGALILALVYSFATRHRPYPGIPVVTLEVQGYRRFLPTYFQWLMRGQELLDKGLQVHPSCFQVRTGSGYKVIVPNRFAHELRSHPGLSFNEAFASEFFVNYPGFEGHRQGLIDEKFIQEVVRVKLTQSLSLITGDLVEETVETLHDFLGEPTEWKTYAIKESILDIVARLSSRVFLGEELCRNPEWLRISKNYTIDSFMGAQLLRMCPDLARPILYWFIPTCTRLRAEVRDARKLIEPEVQRRHQRAQEAIRAGEKVPKKADAIGWMVDVANGTERQGKVDFVAAQLSLSMAAIHTTSETLVSCLVILCQHPEIIGVLRTEMVDVLRREGWAKTSLYGMKLLDSFLKEVQRTNGLSSTTMNRLTKQTIKLSDGTVLNPNTKFMVSDDRVKDPEAFPEPSKFDVGRFARLRTQPGEENRHQFVTPTTDSMGFGYGQHACPGRFFASNELKIALCTLLLKYDMRFVPGEERPSKASFETSAMTDPKVRVDLRRRTEEVDLTAPQTKA